MARLPIPGSDEGTWGDILNDYLATSHNSDGTLKNNTVSAAKIQDTTISEAKLDTALAAKVNSLAGDPTMGGDLSGTASNAQIVAGSVDATALASNAVTTAKIADSNVTTGKIADDAVTVAKLATAASPTSGQLLVYNGSALGWTDPATVPADLADLGDVNTAGATDGQSLVYQSGTWIPATVSGGGGVTDHGALTGLADDDHAQYHNDARGDARYYTQAQVDTSLSGKSDTSHTHTLNALSDVDTTGVANGDVLKYNGSSWIADTDQTGGGGDPTMGGDLSGTASNAQIVAGAVDTTELADDAVTDGKVATGISQAKITNLTTDLAGKANTSHNHAAGDITSGTMATARLGSGTANNSTYLRGDGTWATPAGGGVSLGGPITVASSDAPQDVKDACEYVCTGTNDQTIINQALQQASRPNDGFGGDGRIGVCLVGHNFYIGNNNSTSITMYPSTHLFGLGPGTLLQPQFTTPSIDRGVIELLNGNTAHVKVSNLTIARANATTWEGHGIKFSGLGTGDTYEIKSGNDPYNKIENVWIGFARGKGAWLTGTSGGSRESQVFHCVFWNCDEQGLLIDGSSDSQISDCRANGGNSFPRFEIGGGNTKIANCKAYYSGNGTTDGDGFLISSSRCEVANCAAQDNGRWGFRFTGANVTATGLVADSNSRTQSDGGAFAIEANGVYEGLHAFDRGQTPAFPQNRGIVYSGTPDVYVTGRISLESGSNYVVNSASGSSYARVLRDGSTLYSVG